MDTFSQPRFQMWLRLLGDEYLYATKPVKERLKLNYVTVNGYASLNDLQPTLEDYAKTYTATTNYTTIEPTPMVSPIVTSGIINSINLDRRPEPHAVQKENNMCDCCSETTPEFNLDEARIEHLRSRVRMIERTKYHALERKYGILDDDKPVGAEALLARIASGKYTLVEDSLWGVQGHKKFRWRDPSVKEDYEGFKVATDTMDKQGTDVIDAIMVLPAAEALVKVQAFETADLP